MPGVLNVKKGLAVTDLGGGGEQVSTFYATLRKLDLIHHSPGSHILFFYRLNSQEIRHSPLPPLLISVNIIMFNLVHTSFNSVPFNPHLRNEGIKYHES